MKTLVTGITGQLGHDVCLRLGNRAVGVSSRDFDLTDEAAVIKYVEKLKPDAIIHCAAYTAVDKAEDNPERCIAVNVGGTRNLAHAATMVGAKLLYISSDYVFDGTLDRPYEIDDGTNPLNVYGKSKLLGENAVRELVRQHFIVRTSWVFGANGGNFVKTMLRLVKEGRKLKVVSDQIGSPTYTCDLAQLLCEMIETEKYGVYHVTNSGFCSWYEFACEIFKQAGIDAEITPVDTAEFPTRARRPQNSRLSQLSLDSAGFERMRDWKPALAHFLEHTDIVEDSV